MIKFVSFKYFTASWKQWDWAAIFYALFIQIGDLLLGSKFEPEVSYFDLHSNQGSCTSIFIWTSGHVLWSTFKSGVLYFDLLLNRGCRTSIYIQIGSLVIRSAFEPGVSHFDLHLDLHLNWGSRTSIYIWTWVSCFDLHLNRGSLTSIYIWTNPSAVPYKTQIINLYLRQMTVTGRFVWWQFSYWLWNFVEKLRKIIIMTTEPQCQ